MDWVNYHHLLYFRTVAREGSITSASKTLALAQPTISGQIRALEETLGQKLFARQGRNLVMTDFGRIVYRYADEIFSLGEEMSDALRGRPAEKPARLSVGIADHLPAALTRRIVSPALEVPEAAQLVCHQDKTDSLLAALQMHTVDLVVSDMPVSPGGRVKAHNHLLGTSGMSVFGSPDLATGLRDEFPRSLNEAPFIVPAEGTAGRRNLDHWLASASIRPKIVAEVACATLSESFGEAGAGVFLAPSVIEDVLEQNHRVSLIGRIPELQERFYLISSDRKRDDAAVMAIVGHAKGSVFGSVSGKDEAA